MVAGMRGKEMKTGILLLAYGAANAEAKTGLSGFEALCRSAFPRLTVRWAFTSETLRDRLARQRQKSDSTVKALMRFHYERFAAVAVQPLQLIPGKEYSDAAEAVRKTCAATGLRFSLGRPLLCGEESIPRAACALCECLPGARKEGDSVIFMAHGARHPAGALYAGLGAALASAAPRTHVAAMSSAPYLEDILPALPAGDVWLMPLLSVAGTHALRDMAGPGAQSWKSRIEASGRRCFPILRGMAEYPAVARLWLNNLAAAINALDEPPGGR